MRFTAGALLILVGLSCCCLVLSQERDTRNGPESSGRASLSAPRLFDFGRFKEMFRKSYGSVMEEVARQKIFLARAFHAFMSMVNYKHYKSSHFERVNEMSDWTEAELGSMFMVRDDSDKLKQLSLDEDLSKHPAVELEEIEENLREISQSDDPAMTKIAAELRATQSRRKREIASDLIDSNRSEEDQLSALSALQLKLAANTKGTTGYIGSLLKSGLSKLKSGEELPKATKLPNEIFFDHRKSGCFTPIKNQGRCGSCYIFSTTALYEYQYCKETGELVALSEQYPLDCGDRMGMTDCRGGYETVVSKFYHNYGFELAADYPYRHKKISCPYEASMNGTSMGHLRVRTPRLINIRHDEFETYIKTRPIIMSFGADNNFHAYGGGVDLGKRCNKSKQHSMVIVGSGREDDIEYWLIRNSFGTSWGENGYYKLSKGADFCLGDEGMGQVLMYEEEEGGKVFEGVNPLNDGEIVKKNVHKGFTNTMKDIVNHI